MNTQVLHSPDGQPIRATTIDGDPWFVATDVASMLRQGRASELVRSLPDDEKQLATISTQGGPQRVSVINEAGLFRAILTRRTGRIDDPAGISSVQDLQRWVTHDLLPAVHSRGQVNEANFDDIRHVSEDGSEYWSARDLMTVLGYPAWQHFIPAMERAQVAARNQGHVPEALFKVNREKTGGRPREDYHLTRFAAYLVAMNSDPRKSAVAAAQAYFAIRTRQAEIAELQTQPAISGPELMALALREADSTLRQQKEQIAELEPRATAWDEFLSTSGDSSVNEAAKALSRKSGRIIGEKRLRGLLEQWRWVYRDGRGRPRAYQAQVDNGRLAERTRFHYHPESGEKVVDAPQVRVTAKGLDAIRDRLSKEAAA